MLERDKIRQFPQKNQRKQLPNSLKLLIATLGLSACGGGGGSGDAISPPPPPPPTNQAPNAVITVNQNSGIAPVTIQFSGTSSTDADGSIDSYAWDFDSDGTVDDRHPSAVTTYSNAGSFTATLTVTDNDGATSTSTIEIIVERAAEKILFRAQEIGDSNLNLFLMNDDGTERLQLNVPDSTSFEIVRDAKFSPDGQWIAYTEGRTTSAHDLMVVPASGGDPIRLNQDIGMNQQKVSDYEWSPDSTQIVYTINSGQSLAREVWLVNRDGSEQVKISGRLGNIVEVYDPKWSSDGQYIFQTVRNLQNATNIGINFYDTTLGTSNSTRLFTTVDNTRTLLIQPTTSNIGSKICFASSSASGTELRVSDATLPTPNSELLSLFPFNNCRWNHDDSRILTTITNAGFTISQLQALDPGNMNSPITYAERGNGTSGFNSGSQRWRPGSNDEVSYRGIAPGSSTESILLSNADGDTLDLGLGSAVDDSLVNNYLWNPDGSTMIYSRYYNATQSFDLFTVDADGSNTLNLTEAVPQSDRISRFLWSQDMSHILFNTIDTSDPTPGNTVAAIYSVSLENQEAIEITGKIFSQVSIYGYQPKP